MKKVLCTVRDIKAQSMGRVFSTDSTAVAVRIFREEVNRASEDNPFYKWPDDFELIHCANYDDETAVVEAIHPVTLALASDLRAK